MVLLKTDNDSAMALPGACRAKPKRESEAESTTSLIVAVLPGINVVSLASIGGLDWKRSGGSRLYARHRRAKMGRRAEHRS